MIKFLTLVGLAFTSLVAFAETQPPSIDALGYENATEAEASVTLVLKISTVEYGEILQEEFFYKPKHDQKDGDLRPFLDQAGGGYGDGNGFNYRASVVVDISTSPPEIRIKYDRIDHPSKKKFKRKATIQIEGMKDFSKKKSGLMVTGKWLFKEPNKTAAAQRP